MGDFRESQVASTSRIYAEEGIDLLYPKLNVMGDPGYFVLEFPVYQAMVALLWDVADLGSAWGHILSHAFWIIATIYLYFLCLLFITDRRIALLTCFLFVFAPISLVYSHQIGIEAMGVCLSIMFLYYGARWIITNRFWCFLAALVICTIGFLQKLPNIAPMFVPLLAVKFVYGRKKVRSIFSPLFILLGLIPFVMALVWQHHAGQVNSMCPASALHSVGHNIHWYFGTLTQRLNPIKCLIVVLKSFENAFGSIYGGILVIIGLLFTARKYYFFSFYLLGYLFSYLVFTGLHLPHIHYMIPFLAPMVFFAAVGLMTCWDNLKVPAVKLFKREIKSGWIGAVVIIGAAGLFVVNSGRYLDFRDLIFKDEDIAIMGKTIEAYTPQESRVMFYWARGTKGGTWNPQLLYLAHRRGIYVNLDMLKREDLNNLMEKYGCDYLVLAGDSLKWLYVHGRKLHTLIYGRKADFSDLDFFTLRLPDEIEEKLLSLEPVYRNNRLRIYKKNILKK